MAELVLSALLSVLFDRLASEGLNRVARYIGIDAKIKKLQRELSQIQNVLADASQKERNNPAVKRWLNDLQHLAYDIDDVFDDLATEDIHREFNSESEGVASKIRKLTPTWFTRYPRSTTMVPQLDDISKKLQFLLKEKADLGLSVNEETKAKNNNNSNRRLQSSVVDPSSIIGRQAEKEALVQQLLSPADEPCDQNYSIVPIVGMGGVGKTTLARLVYDENKVNDHFELKAWVCVSDDFDSFGISKIIFQSVTGLIKEFADFNLLQVELVTNLRGKRFLLVLDDVWSESCEDWKTLVAPFYACAPGSKIIMTTRKQQLLQQLGYGHQNELEGVLHDDALSLFSLHALGVNNFDSHLSLKPYAEAIVKKCGGIPLALIALGRLLRTKENEVEQWKEVSNSEIWQLKDEGGILPALRISYFDISAPLKQLFAYCSLFPKDFLFDKEELVLLWMAEGFLHPPTLSDSTEERLGHELFEELLSRSFFQRAPNNESLFVMHDLINDLATRVSGEFFVRVDNGAKKNMPEKYMLEKCRHMSFVREGYAPNKKFEAFTRAKSLRTFLATSVGVLHERDRFYISHTVLVDLSRELSLLRVLCLSNFKISEVPETIGTLKHLRYINLSRTRITHVPENVCNLYNLKILILYGCKELNKLPNGFLKLKSLRHLDIRDTPRLVQMPLEVGELKKLQTLSRILIGDESGFKITKLKEFSNLCGKISIEGLEKVENAVDAREANFSQKRLSELELLWSDEEYDSRNEVLEKEVLKELKPCNDKLIQLKVMSYGGLEFPKWVGDPSFLRLKHVSLRNCKRCTSLPPLGQLYSLKELFISGLNGVKFVGMELAGIGGAFPSLEILSFTQMNGWEKWSMNSEVVFPRVKELYIEDCPKLVEVELKALPILNVLEIKRCDSGVLRRLVEIAYVVTKLKIRDISRLNDVVWRDVTGYLKALKELHIYKCNEIQYLWESEAVASKLLVNLRKIEVENCDNLVKLGEKEEDSCPSNLLTSLRMLDVHSCKNMVRCSCPDSIVALTLANCTLVTTISLPTGGQKLKSFEVWNCPKLLEGEWVGEITNSERSSMPMLESAFILNWPYLKSIVGLSYSVNLTTLFIQGCEGLESLPDHELSKLTSLRKLRIANCPNMDASFPRGVWPPNLHTLDIGNLNKSISEWDPQNFPASLEDLRLRVGDCSEFSHLLPSSLTHLHIIGFEKFEFTTGLQHLVSLQHLYFIKCPNMKKVSHPQHLHSLQHLIFHSCPEVMDLPVVLLPSLLSLRVGNCPNLEERCRKSNSSWPLISHIPCIVVARPAVMQASRWREFHEVMEAVDNF